jgi:hypothetical protein
VFSVIPDYFDSHRAGEWTKHGSVNPQLFGYPGTLPRLAQQLTVGVGCVYRIPYTVIMHKHLHYQKRLYYLFATLKDLQLITEPVLSYHSFN